jgi:hypothetical protein
MKTNIRIIKVNNKSASGLELSLDWILGLLLFFFWSATLPCVARVGGGVMVQWLFNFFLV